jgi:hypothetical protein
MAVYEDLAAEMCGRLPGFSVYLAEKAILRATQWLFRQRTWSFSIAEGAFNAPTVIQAGSVTVTLNSASVVADVTAAAALNAVAAATPALTSRQFRIGSGGAIYNIINWNNGTRTLTLDRNYLGATAAGATYSVYQCYFPPPPQALIAATGLYDFNRWISVLDAVNGYTLGLQKDKAWLDRRDPQRSDSNLAYEIVEYKANSSGDMLWEFWPHPTSGQTFNVIYKTAGLAMGTGEVAIPAIIPDDLILNRALYHDGYPWAATNAGRDPGLAKTNWLALKQDARKDWLDDLQKAKLEDDNINLQSLLSPVWSQSCVGPIDASFIQGHDMAFFGRRGM